MHLLCVIAVASALLSVKADLDDEFFTFEISNEGKGKITSTDLLKYCPNFAPEKATPTLESALEVGLVLTPYNFVEIDNAAEEMSFNGLITINWRDTRCDNEDLLWNETLSQEKCDDKIYPDPGVLWKPTIRTRQSPEMYLKGENRQELLTVKVQSPGVWDSLQEFETPKKLYFYWFWEVGGIYTFHCDLNLLLFPFDVQNCSFVLEIGQPSYLQKFIRCRINYEPETSNFTSRNTKWLLIDMKCNFGIVASHSTTKVSIVTISFLMARLARFHMMNFILPCILLIFLQLCSFAMPVDETDRTAFTVTIYLAFIFIQSMLFTVLPQTPNQILLTDHIQFQSVFSTCITVYSAIIFKISKLFKTSHVKVFCKKIIIAHAIDLAVFIFCVFATLGEIGWVLITFWDNYVDYNGKITVKGWEY